MATDPLSDFLGLTRAHSNHTGGFTAGGAWSIAVPAPETLKFWAAVRGGCWLVLEGDAPIRIEEGDVFLLAQPRNHLLASSLKAKPRPLEHIMRGRKGPIVQVGKGDDVLMLGGTVILDRTGVEMLVGSLPPVVHVRAASRIAQTLHWLADQLVREREDELLGAEVASAQLAHLMFIQILRAHFEDAARTEVGWLSAASDERLAPALRKIHAEPGRNWRLAELARAAAMSRATFAACFKAVAGVSPVAYVTEWRMRLAVKALREERASVGELARTLGYASESAFSHAFKRVTGESPRACRHGSGKDVRKRSAASAVR